MKASTSVVRIGSLELRFLIDETQSAGRVVMFEMTVPPNARVPAPHYHREVDEAVYVLEGTLTMSLDGQKHELGQGDSLFVSRGSVHGFENLAAETARSLAVLTPGSIGRGYFEDIAAAVNVPGKPDLATIKEIMLRTASFRPECGQAGAQRQPHQDRRRWSGTDHGVGAQCGD